MPVNTLSRKREEKEKYAKRAGGQTSGNERGERKRNFTVIAAQNFGVRYARLIPCVKTLTQKASGKARTGAGDASAARKKPLRFFAEAFAVLSFMFFLARTRRAYNDYPAPVR